MLRLQVIPFQNITKISCSLAVFPTLLLQKHNMEQHVFGVIDTFRLWGALRIPLQSIAH